MLVINQRQRHPCWRMLLAIVILSGLIRYCEPMSTKRLTDSSPSSLPTLSRSSGESRSQNLGSPSDLAWQAWLLLGSQTGGHSSLDSASFLKRITPKSVFIAPELPACPDGYRADTMGRCVKRVIINPQAHIGFLLQQLNSRYSNQAGGSEASANNKKKSSGPLQLNIPLFSDTDTKSVPVDHEETRGDHSINIPIVVPSRENVQVEEIEEEVEEVKEVEETKNVEKVKDLIETKNVEEATDVVEVKSVKEAKDVIEVKSVKEAKDVIEMKNVEDMEDIEEPKEMLNTSEGNEEEQEEEEEEEEENEPSVTPGNTTISDEPSENEEDDQSTTSTLDTIVPVAEFVDDTNDTNFSDVIDYKIPIDLPTPLNISNVRATNASDDQELWGEESQLLNSTEVSPMLILLSSTTTMSPNSIAPEIELELANSTRRTVQL
ncbi:homeobox-like protein HDP1 [Bombus flavifrons]|uniref:homeobox-like protein HDP1 n=1 Tax=Bombus flavifrons TaxID=103934 RepID=UPI0037043EA0